MIDASLNEAKTGWICGTGKQERLVVCRLVLDKHMLSVGTPRTLYQEALELQSATQICCPVTLHSAQRCSIRRSRLAKTRVLSLNDLKCLCHNLPAGFTLNFAHFLQSRSVRLLRKSRVAHNVALE